MGRREGRGSHTETRRGDVGNEEVAKETNAEGG